MTRRHTHPGNFRLERSMDRGWAEIACEYIWDALITGSQESGDADALSLEHCFLYEFTTYDCSSAELESGWLLPPNPPFTGWRFRNPTDGRSGPVGFERFEASLGRAWDRHKLPGPLELPLSAGCWTIRAVQQYCFHCELCGYDGPVTGPEAGPHPIIRTLRSTNYAYAKSPSLSWRYEIAKHEITAWMDIDHTGYLTDSAQIGFGPSWTEPQRADSPIEDAQCTQATIQQPTLRHLLSNGSHA